jgi:hypothetical protein
MNSILQVPCSRTKDVRFHLWGFTRVERLDRALVSGVAPGSGFTDRHPYIRTRTAAGGLSIVSLKTEVMSMMNHTIRRPPRSCAALSCAAFAA